MKTKLKTLFLVAALCSTIALSATDYVMLRPLDTTALPMIPHKDSGGQIVRSALNSDALWDNTLKQLSRQHFSDESVFKVMKKLYRNTHKHYACRI